MAYGPIWTISHRECHQQSYGLHLLEDVTGRPSLAPGVEGVVNRKLQVELPMVIRTDGSEAVGNGLEARGLGSDPHICGDVGPVDNASQHLQSRILQSKLLD